MTFCNQTCILIKNRKSWDKRRKFSKFPDYLLAIDNFTELLDNKIKEILRENVRECKFWGQGIMAGIIGGLIVGHSKMQESKYGLFGATVLNNWLGTLHSSALGRLKQTKMI